MILIFYDLNIILDISGLNIFNKKFKLWIDVH